MEKGSIPKLESDKQNLIEEKKNLKDKLAEVMEENKFITSERAKL